MPIRRAASVTLSLLLRRDISIYVGFAVSGLVYYALMRDRIGGHAQAIEDPAHARTAQPQQNIGTAVKSEAEEAS
jgi:hypothetical protein